MRRLNRARADESGAVIVLMAVATVTLVAMAAMVVDVGSVLDEKRQLQNGADAGALAIAHSCAFPGPCNDALAAGLADGNSRDGASAAAVTHPTVGQVKVQTSTLDGGTNILPYRFGQALTGAKGKQVTATATASWGPLGTAVALPLAISQCDVQKLSIGTYSVILFAGNPTCGSKDAAGAFGWLDGTCPATTFTAGMLATGDPGKSGPKGCLSTIAGTDVLVPVFVQVTGNGNNTVYRIVGFAAFHLTGWGFPGDESSPRPCGSSASCIAGTFVKFVTSTGVAGGTDFGASRVFLVS